MPSGIEFPAELDELDMELLLKEWELLGGKHRKESYYIGFYLDKERWEAFYIHNLGEGAKWITSDKILGEKAAFEIRKATWMGHYWADTDVNADIVGKTIGIYTAGEVDYKLEEYLMNLAEDGEEMELLDAEGMATAAEQNIREVFEETLGGFMEDLDRYSEE